MLLTVGLGASVRLLGIAALVLATATGVLAGFLLGVTALAVGLAAALHGAAGFAVFTTVATLAAGRSESRWGKCGQTNRHEKEGRTFHRVSLLNIEVHTSVSDGWLQEH
jgi:hypothetical protein